MRGRVFLAFLAMVLQLSKRGKIMERLENRHNSGAQAAVSEEIATDNTLSLADLHKRNLEYGPQCGHDPHSPQSEADA